MVTLIKKFKIRFTFGEFVRFIVNGSVEFSDDNYVINHQGPSYHWAPYWKECEPCSDITSPNFIIHLDTLREDLPLLINHLQGHDIANKEVFTIVDMFPHTHSTATEDEKKSTGKALSSNEAKLRKYFSTLSRLDIEELYEKYKLDHELFGYAPKDFLKYMNS